MTYAFDVILAGIEEMTDDIAEALFVAGCDDCVPCSRDGIAYAGFDREAASLDEAVRSAVADVQKAGQKVAWVRIHADSLAAIGGGPPATATPAKG